MHGFSWSDENVVRKMRFVRVPFGNKSSPFSLNATVKHHLSKFAPSRVVDELSENMYVDDWLSGCDDHSEACDMLNKANVIMGQAGMSLAKWWSNSEQVGNLLCREFQDKLMGEESHRVLGMSKRHNDIDKDAFLTVLTNRRSGGGFNRGFRVHGASGNVKGRDHQTTIHLPTWIRVGNILSPASSPDRLVVVRQRLSLDCYEILPQ